MKGLRGKAVIGQSGGPTHVINESLAGVILEAREHPEIEQLLGARYGVKGIFAEDFVDLSSLAPELVERVAKTPGAVLGSVRHKPTQADCERIFGIFRRNNVRFFFYIGGNDSAEAAHTLNQLATEYEINIIHIPKTVDNDLLVTDHCPGYGTAARYVALTFMGDNLDTRALPGVKVNVVMGRNAGWLTGASVLARVREDDGPHLIYLPERTFEPEEFVADVESVYRKLGRCVVAVSEGVRRVAEQTLVEELQSDLPRDAFGHVQLSGSGFLGDYLMRLLRERISPQSVRRGAFAPGTAPKPASLRVRADTLGYAQRSFAGVRSEVDAAEARAVGVEAVRQAVVEGMDGSVAIRRKSNNPYEAELFLTTLDSVGSGTKEVPDAWINSDGNGVTEAFVQYVKPLAGELPTIGWL